MYVATATADETVEYNAIAFCVRINWRNVAYYAMHECKIRFQFGFNTTRCCCWCTSRLCRIRCATDSIGLNICPVRTHSLYGFTTISVIPLFSLFILCRCAKDIIRFMLCFFFFFFSSTSTAVAASTAVAVAIWSTSKHVTSAIVFSVSIMPIVCFVCVMGSHIGTRAEKQNKTYILAHSGYCRVHMLLVWWG